jgi:ketosteroid isomerase-like protein
MTRFTFLFSSLYSLLAALLLTAHAADNPSKQEKAVLEAVHAWDKSYVVKDVAGLERSMADDFMGSWADGTTSTKSEEIANLKSGKYKLFSITYRDEKVRVYGSTAVATMAAVADEEYEGKRENSAFRSTVVLVKRKGAWQIVSVHTSKIEKK